MAGDIAQCLLSMCETMELELQHQKKEIKVELCANLFRRVKMLGPFYYY
jgi:hypothetical protein